MMRTFTTPGEEWQSSVDAQPRDASAASQDPKTPPTSNFCALTPGSKMPVLSATVAGRENFPQKPHCPPAQALGRYSGYHSGYVPRGNTLVPAAASTLAPSPPATPAPAPNQATRPPRAPSPPPLAAIDAPPPKYTHHPCRRLGLNTCQLVSSLRLVEGSRTSSTQPPTPPPPHPPTVSSPVLLVSYRDIKLQSIHECSRCRDGYGHLRCNTDAG